MMRPALSLALFLSFCLQSIPLFCQQGSLQPPPVMACRPSRIADFGDLRVFDGTASVPLAMHCGEADPSTCHTIQLDLSKPEMYQGDLISPGNTQGPWTCAVVGGWSGWVPTDRLKSVPSTPAITTEQWLGTWIPSQGSVAGNRLVLTRSAAGHGTIHVEGRATYTNVAHNAFYGDVSGDAIAMGPFLRILDYGEQPDCVLDLKYDVAKRMFRAVDNQRCGGHNVTFDGVWRRR